MFSFFNKKPITSRLLKVDIHSHLIPSIDDGAKNIEDSIAMIKELKELGYQKLIITPHIMSDTYKNDINTINNGLKLVQDGLEQDNVDITLDVAAEYYLDDGFLDKLQSTEMLAINGKYLLFETSYMSKPIQLEDTIFAISSAGYIPLMAHPERYRYVKNIEEDYFKLRSLGTYFQVNINSFGGYYGKDAQQKAIFLSKSGMIDFLGSDTHNLKQIKSLNKVIKTKEYSKIFNENNILNDYL
jgi:tyrosine-protein phosphatase YwqE